MISHKIIKITGIASTAIVILSLLYIAMLMDTNSIMHRAEGHFSGSVQPDSADPLNRYNFIWNRDRSYHDATTTKFNISRRFVWHNFKDGYIDVKYYYKYYDENDKLISGSMGVPSRWIIHKENGNWKVVEVIENP